MPLDYGLMVRNLILFYGNTSAICISKYLIQHLRTKYIDIRHQLIRDLVELYTFYLQYIIIDLQFADTFTKPLNFLKFESLRKAIGSYISP